MKGELRKWEGWEEGESRVRSGHPSSVILELIELTVSLTVDLLRIVDCQCVFRANQSREYLLENDQL